MTKLYRIKLKSQRYIARHILYSPKSINKHTFPVNLYYHKIDVKYFSPKS